MAEFLFDKRVLDDFVQNNSLKLVAEFGTDFGSYLIYDGVGRGLIFRESDGLFSLYSVVDRDGVKVSRHIQLDYIKKLEGEQNGRKE
jgi:hypothetical protein